MLKTEKFLKSFLPSLTLKVRVQQKGQREKEWAKKRMLLQIRCGAVFNQVASHSKSINPQKKNSQQAATQLVSHSTHSRSFAFSITKTVNNLVYSISYVCKFKRAFI